MDPQGRMLLVVVQEPEGLADRLALGRREALGPEGPEEGVGEVERPGRLTLPAEVRQRLGLDGETEFDVEVTDRGSVTLRPVVVVPRDDAWAYTAAAWYGRVGFVCRAGEVGLLA
jgi:AbrB family looped-hinge helix DNA binding protein